MSLDKEVFEAIVSVVENENPRETQPGTFKWLTKIVANILENPAEEKFRHLSMTSSILQKHILPAAGGFDFLVALGFARSEDNSALVLRADVMNIDALQHALEVLQAHVARAPAPSAPSPASKAPRADAKTPVAAKGTQGGCACGNCGKPKTQADLEYEERKRVAEARKQAILDKQRQKRAQQHAIEAEIHADQDQTHRRPVHASERVETDFGARAKTWDDIGVKLSNCGGGS